ncbi:histidinol-phosphate transaminase [Bizionia gelidisalsuginis]|uniref:Histidinol-phosphate aminotransferase n=1 Tax=Bizionia gelidisalsuginis TaxID=291188 RepID=A0ABY3M9L9_9FLAO|nr:histidinol-phosphate transaminase [Bizionia gelidisalsuginis]TYC11959.1 histidinol-phosphate transaminase [Bizionia gelidisalsuginis]
MSIQHLIRANIKALKPYSSARDEFQEKSNAMVFLDANENPFENGVNRYPDPQQLEVKNLLSQIKECPIENIVLGNGSDEILDLIIRAFCEPNQDNIITLPPTYGMYEVLANINAVAVKKVVLTEDFQPRVDAILEAATAHSKILFLCSPNNPSGNSFSGDSVDELLRKFKGVVVIDEAYIDFSEQQSWLNKLEQFPNLIITQTLSKAYGLAAIRLGVCYASAEITRVLNSIKPPYNVNALTQEKAKERLLNIDTVSEEIERIKNNRSTLISALKSIYCVEKIYPSDCNFVLIKVDNATKRYSELINKGIVIRNRTNESLCHNCLRLTVGTAKENALLIQSLEALK